MQSKSSKNLGEFDDHHTVLSTAPQVEAPHSRPLREHARERRTSDTHDRACNLNRLTILIPTISPAALSPIHTIITTSLTAAPAKEH